VALEDVLESVPELRDATQVDPLAGGLTNTNYKVTTPTGCYVVRILGKDTGLLAIDRENEERGGAVELVKIDVDSNREVSERFGVSGIPAVKAFRDGRVVAEFVGALSPTAVSAFFDGLLAPPRADALVDGLRADRAFPKILAALESDDIDGALALITSLVPAATAPDRERLRDLAVALFEQLGQDDPLAVNYRRKLAAALY